VVNGGVNGNGAGEVCSFDQFHDDGEHLGFALEALHAGGVLGECGWENLHRHFAIQFRNRRAIYGAHAAFAELGGDAVVGNGVGQAHRAEFSHGTISDRLEACSRGRQPLRLAPTTGCSSHPLAAMCINAAGKK
jgi:hypothetical protein